MQAPRSTARVQFRESNNYKHLISYMFFCDTRPAHQGTQIVGKYSIDVDFGQRRILLVWNRLIFPNGRSVVL